ncbi:rhodanese-like domain-containing protein [Marimonas arenosa]|uniref:Rhodanese-like domain-containing protein n=1 Tax=Marimonas arenosa TaxID=1795305 RepID=A0AAE4B2Y1_9RHOB|nr:rhodanese-like domain-containing protein [Marimonas arenosa]MDQ2088715.1 rhodanese-like domain-containing protein [Marimonas arenosa]
MTIIDKCRGLYVAFAVGLVLVPSAVVAESTVKFVSAVDPATVPEKKRSALNLYLTAQEASDFLAQNDDAVLIDIRTRAEVSFVGIAAEVDKNIPYMVMDEFWEFDAEKGTYKMEVNSNFDHEVAGFLQERGLSKEAPIILMCRSGSRSARAADLLGQLGYTSVYSVVDGFEGDKDPNGVRSVNGWKNAKLAWTYKIRNEQAY